MGRLSAGTAALLVLVASASPIRAEGPVIRPEEGRPEVSWKDAGHVVGREARVSGKVVDFKQLSHLYLLRIGEDMKHWGFTIVIPTEELANFPDPPSLMYVGKYVRARGLITTYAGQPQVFVGTPDRIEVLSEPPQVPAYQPPKVEPKAELTVATYNILNLFDARDEPYHNDEYTRVKPREELERLAKVIREISPDVLALQEVESRGYLGRFLDVFCAELGYQHLAHFEGNDLRGIDVCLVSRVPLGPVLSHRHVSFPDETGKLMRFNRDLLCVEVRPVGGVPFEVWVVHLKSKSGGEASDVIRLAEATYIRKMLDERLSANPEARIIVCGDFNDDWSSPTLKRIVGSGSTGLKCFADELPADQRITYNKEPYRSMIDFILCDPGMAQRYVKGSFAIRAGTVESSGSDHNPVLARFRVK
jgi:endonuclease/exonuclease/phosphatase family metal-dependent hydrolase